MNVSKEEVKIHVKAIFSKNKKYRYYLKKTWGKGNKNIAFLMFNPSKADTRKSDNTVNNATNYAVENGFDSITIVNLFSYMSTDKKDFKNREYFFEKINNEYIEEALNECEEFVIAWERGIHKKRKMEVLKILEKHPKKLNCFTKYDEQGNVLRKVNHLRVMGKDLKYEGWDYEKDLAAEFKGGI